MLDKCVSEISFNKRRQLFEGECQSSLHCDRVKSEWDVAVKWEKMCRFSSENQNMYLRQKVNALMGSIWKSAQKTHTSFITGREMFSLCL